MKKIEPLGYNSQRASELLTDNDLDGLLLGAPENVYYTTGCPTLPGTGNPILYALRNTVPSFAYINSDGKVTLFTWFGVTLGVEYSAELVTYADINGAKDELQTFFQKTKKVGVDYGVPYYALQALKNAGSESVDADSLAVLMRLVKNQKEIQRLEKSLHITQDVLIGIGPRLRAGMSRKSVLAEARSMMMQYGATAVDHLTIAFGPSNPEILIDELLKREQLITMDLGAIYEGYTSDIRRLYYAGEEIAQNDLKLFEIVIDMIDSLQDFMEPGKTYGQIYEKATKLYEKNGFDPLFASAGHSIGLVTEESHLSPDNVTLLSKNMVINVELYIPNENGIMIGDEETYFIDTNGARRMTDLDRKIFKVGL
ncbi:MAG: M24 family metallopeptidase [Nitrososphaeria archaeon]